jgi:hypothetical protein
LAIAPVIPLSLGSKKASKLRQKHQDFNRLLDLYDNYTAKYRNRFVHGAATLTQDDFENLLRHIDISYIVEFERVLKIELGRSAFDGPDAWGAPASKRRKDFDSVRKAMKRLARNNGWEKTFGGEKILQSNINKIRVTSILNRTQYSMS